MLKYFVWVVRDLALPGILLGIIFYFTSFFNIKRQKKFVFWGTLAGFAMALFIAIVKENTLIRDKTILVFNLVFMGIILAAGLVYLVFSWIVFSKKSGCPFACNFALDVAGGLFAFALISYELPNVLLYPFHFLISGQSVMSTDFLFKFIGFVLGLLVVFLATLTVYKILKNLPCLCTVVYSSVVIFSNFIGLLGLFLSPMIVRRWIKVSRALRKQVMFLLNHQLIFTFIAIAITFVIAAILIYVSLNNHEKYTNPAEHRKIRAKCRNLRRWAFASFFFYLLIIVDLTVLKKITEKVVVLSAAEPFEIEGDIISIPFENVRDGMLHRFEYETEDGVGIRFIIIQKNAFAFGIGFDACEICGATGYYFKNGKVICKLCDVVMNINTIGFPGGCNPIPLPYKIQDGEIKINAKDLLVEKRRFR